MIPTVAVYVNTATTLKQQTINGYLQRLLDVGLGPARVSADMFQTISWTEKVDRERGGAECKNASGACGGRGGALEMERRGDLG